MVINRLSYHKYYHPENADDSIKKENELREASNIPRTIEIKNSMVTAIPAIVMPVIILGGIYSGVFTATEAGGIGCLYAIICGIILRASSWKSTWNCFTETSKDLGVILLIAATSAVFNRILLLAQMPSKISHAFLSVTNQPNIIILFIALIFLIAGCFLSPPVIIFVITPLLLPTARMIGMGDVQFGVILMVAIGIGLVTPPVAGNLFISARMAKINIAEMIPSLMPYLFFASIPMLILVCYVPILSTWLPGLFGYN